MEIQLDCGRAVSVYGFSFGYTYLGLLEGRPNKGMNQAIFSRTTYPSNWGQRTVLKLQPEASAFEDILPSAHYAVWLTSFDPVDPRFDCSELVVIWFAETPKGKNIEDIITQGVKSIDWNANAEDLELDP